MAVQGRCKRQPSPATGRRNHITTAPHAKFLYVRDSTEEWHAETPFALEIERLGQARADPLSRDEMAQCAGFRTRDDVPLYFWFQSTFTNKIPNSWKFLPANRGTGGLVTQVIARGRFDLGSEDAVIVEFNPGGAAYSAIQMGGWLFQSIEALRLTSSLTRLQCGADGDGLIRAVISREDPGVTNWLDCGGLSRVMAMLRWQGLPSPSATGGGGPGFSCRLVRLDELRKALPPQQRPARAAASRARSRICEALCAEHPGLKTSGRRAQLSIATLLPSPRPFHGQGARASQPKAT